MVTLKDEHFGHGKFEEIDTAVTDCLKRMKLRVKTELSMELSAIFDYESLDTFFNIFTRNIFQDTFFQGTPIDL